MKRDGEQDNNGLQRSLWFSKKHTHKKKKKSANIVHVGTVYCLLVTGKPGYVRFAINFFTNVRPLPGSVIETECAAESSINDFANH